MIILSGTHIQLRGRNGRCISVAHKDNDDRFLAVAEGYCVGGEAESLSLRNRHAKPGAAGLEDIQIRYGDRVVVKARAAREKYLTVPQMGAAVYGSKAQREPLEFTRSGLAALNCDDWEIMR